LNPGSFVRLDANTEFEFLTTDLNDLQLRINSGTAILEVFATEDFIVTVNTPNSQFFIVRSGIYRVETLADGSARVEVWKGRVEVGEGGKGKTLKGGQTAVVSNAPGAPLAIVKFDRDDKDEFDLWSRDRAKELDKINAKLQGRQMNQVLLAGFSSGRWNINSSFGLWVRDPFSQNYCFLPFGWGWSSPYGHTYDRSIWNYQRVTRTIYRNNPSWNPPNNGQSGSTPVPPYQSMPGSSGGNTTYNPPAANPSTNNRSSMPSIIERKETGADPARPIPRKN
jgi:hypothetical protein